MTYETKRKREKVKKLKKERREDLERSSLYGKEKKNPSSVRASCVRVKGPSVYLLR